MNQAAVGATPADPAASRPRLVVVSAIGVAQILAWGSSYYLPAVLAKPIATDTGWPLAWVAGSLSIGLLVSGLVSPPRRAPHRTPRGPSSAGRERCTPGLWLVGGRPRADAAGLRRGLGGHRVRHGGGPLRPGLLRAGAALRGGRAQRHHREVTLFGGFSSTVCWPLTAFLAAQLGWRGACLTYAAILVAVVLPLYLLGLPREEERPPQAPALSSTPPGHVRSEQRVAFVLLATGFTLAYGIMTVIAVHLLTLLQSRGVALAAAVGLGALVGPAQVGGRVLEMTFGRKAHPIWSLLASAALVAVGLGMLVAVPGAAAACIVLYGMGSGIRSIARGTVPLALFGREGYAILMGRLALPTLLATAAAPMVGAWLLDWVGPAGTLAALCGAALLHGALVLALLPAALASRRRS